MGTYQQLLHNDSVQIATSVHSVASSEINSGHTLLGESISDVKFLIKKIGSPTGNMHAKLFHSDGSSDIIESKAASSAPTDYSWVTFTASSSITISSGDWIGLEYTSGTYSQDAIVCKWYVNSNTDSNMHVKLYTNSAWTEYSQHEFTFQVVYPYSGSGGSGGGGSGGSGSTSSDDGAIPPDYILYLNTGIPK